MYRNLILVVLALSCKRARSQPNSNVSLSL